MRAIRIGFRGLFRLPVAISLSFDALYI